MYGAQLWHKISNLHMHIYNVSANLHKFFFLRTFESSSLSCIPCTLSCSRLSPVLWFPRTPHSRMDTLRHRMFCSTVFIICSIAIAYSMRQIICVCQCVRLRALSRSHFLIDFHQNWHRRKKPEK